MTNQRRFNSRAFAQESFSGNARAVANRINRAQTREGGDKRASRRCVADAHLADTSDVSPAFRGQRRAVIQSLLRFGARHRRFPYEIARALCDFAIKRPGDRGPKHSAIDHGQFDAERLAKHRNRRAPAHEVAHHLRRDFRGPCAGAFHYGAVVATENVHRFAVQLGFGGSLHLGQIGNEGFQPAQRSRRFCERIPSFLHDTADVSPGMHRSSPPNNLVGMRPRRNRSAVAKVRR